MKNLIEFKKEKAELEKEFEKKILQLTKSYGVELDYVKIITARNEANNIWLYELITEWRIV